MNIERLLLDNDLPEWAEKAGAKLHRSRNEFRGSCPLHGGHNDTGFVIYEECGKQKWHCYSGDCGGGDLIDFIMAWRNCDFINAYKYLGGELAETQTDEEKARIAAERVQRAEERERQKWEEYQKALRELRDARAWVTYTQNLTAFPDARRLWRARGIIDAYQDMWQLGYCNSFTVSSSAGLWTTPTLTIPIFDKDPDPINIRHRLLKPPSPTDKYRPDRPGLHAAPFIADPERDEELERILILEGEIKAAVTYQTIDDYHLQVYGIPGKNNFRAIQQRLENRAVYICFDPDATQQAEEAARAVKGWLIDLPVKIDDAILAGHLDKQALRRLLHYARKA